MSDKLNLQVFHFRQATYGIDVSQLILYYKKGSPFFLQILTQLPMVFRCVCMSGTLIRQTSMSQVLQGTLSRPSTSAATLAASLS